MPASVWTNQIYSGVIRVFNTNLATLVAELHEVIRANTPDEREYKRYMDGIKNSVLTAFYTPPKVADAIVEAIWDTRIAPQRILDPSAGTGVFVNAVDFHDPYAEITCFEKDPATGLILKHLHPEKRVRIQGFERIEPKYAGQRLITGTTREDSWLYPFCKNKHNCK